MKNVVLCAIYLYLCLFLLLNIIIPFIMYIFTLVKESYASLKRCSRCDKKIVYYKFILLHDDPD